MSSEPSGVIEYACKDDWGYFRYSSSTSVRTLPLPIGVLELVPGRTRLIGIPCFGRDSTIPRWSILEFGASARPKR